MTSADLPKPIYARVAVNVPHVQGVFDYHIRESLQGQEIIGQLVTVPFGRQTVQGIIIGFPTVPEVPQTKAVQNIIDIVPAVSQSQIQLAEHIARETLSPLGMVIHAMLPAGLSVKADVIFELSESSLAKIDADEELLSNITPAQNRLINQLIERGPLRGRQLDRAFPHKNWRQTAGSLERRGVITSRGILSDPSVSPKLERRLKFKGTIDDALDQMGSLANTGFPEALKRRQAVLQLVMDSDIDLPLSIIYRQTGSSISDINQLLRRGLVEIIEIAVIRDPLDEVSIIPAKPPVLTRDQETAWNKIESTFSNECPTPFLLHGVTGSGKTEIYLQAVEKTLSLGKQAIILVPEIALTPQTVSRFMSRFPGQVGVIHSELSSGERYDTWRLARDGQISIIVGPRSALFTPFPDPGLIVVDECHDDSYYQGEISPRYHALSAAVAYADITGSVCIVGSATPNLTTTYRSKSGKWHYISLPERILAHRDNIQSQLEQSGSITESPRYIPVDDNLQMAELPLVEVIDMRSELKEGNRSIFSRKLQDALEKTLAKDHQSILFLNRRGSASYIFCRDCGYVLRCPRCETSLTAHQSMDSLRCHHCGYQRGIPQTCPSCRSDRIRHLGTGTEQVETALRELLPGVRTLRWDRDTTRKKGSHWEIMEKFSDHQADVLVGTQMLAKGLDLPLVTLVGVVLADMGLHLPDYRAAERTFQVLTQVAGRAGRSPLGGNVIFQTFDPDHYVIQAASQHDYQGFYQQELDYRRELGYPPFVKLIRLEIKSKDSKKAEASAWAYGSALGGWIKNEGYRGTHLVGPVPAYFSKLRGEYRWQILIKGPNPIDLIRDHPPGPDWIVEVNPPVIL